MGIHENVVTRCVECHCKHDFGINKDAIKKAIRHLNKFYTDWNIKTDVAYTNKLSLWVANAFVIIPITDKPYYY